MAKCPWVDICYNADMDGIKLGGMPCIWMTAPPGEVFKYYVKDPSCLAAWLVVVVEGVRDVLHYSLSPLNTGYFTTFSATVWTLVY